MKFIIATSKYVNRENFAKLMQDIRAFAESENIKVNGAIYTSGNNCYNFALDCSGEDLETFANNLTMAFMPARWTTTNDHIEEKDIFDL